MRLKRIFVEMDLAQVKDLVDRTIEISYASAYPPTAIKFFKNYHRPESILADAQAGFKLIIEEGGALLATGTLLGTNIRRMFVEPTLQGDGLGGALLMSLEEYACQIGHIELDLSASLPARDFYLRHGYRIDNEEAILLPDGEQLRFYAMSKELTDRKLPQGLQASRQSTEK